MSRKELTQKLAGKERHVTGDNKELVGVMRQQALGERNRVARTAWLGLDGELDTCGKRVGKCCVRHRRGDQNAPDGLERPDRLEHPVDQPAPEDRMQVLGNG